MKIIKYSILFFIGGFIYIIFELLYRENTHWTMFFLGGLCFVSLGLINKILSWKTPLWLQAIIGGGLVTTLEFVTGCIVNLWLKWNVWNYAEYDILGQICVPFFFVWCILSVGAIVFDDWLRHWLFHEELPHYVFF